MPRRTNNATNPLKTPPGVGISELLERLTRWLAAEYGRSLDRPVIDIEWEHKKGWRVSIMASSDKEWSDDAWHPSIAKALFASCDHWLDVCYDNHDPEEDLSELEQIVDALRSNGPDQGRRASDSKQP